MNAHVNLRVCSTVREFWGGLQKQNLNCSVMVCVRSAPTSLFVTTTVDMHSLHFVAVVMFALCL